MHSALERGDSPASSVATSFVVFTVAIALVPVTAKKLAYHTQLFLRVAIAEAQRAGDAPPGAEWAACSAIANALLRLTLPLLAACATVALASSLLQARGVLATKRAMRAPSLNASLGTVLGALDPSTGTGLSLITALVRGAVLCATVTYLLVTWLGSHAVDVANISGHRAETIIALCTKIVSNFGTRTAAACVVFGVATELVVATAAWKHRMRMSQREVDDELAASDPNSREATREARHRARHEGTVDGDIKNMHSARVCITDGSAAACVLRYSDDDERAHKPPTIGVRGIGANADRLVTVARGAGIPVVTDAALAKALVKQSAGEPVAENLYEHLIAVLQRLR